MVKGVKGKFRRKLRRFRRRLHRHHMRGRVKKHAIGFRTKNPPSMLIYKGLGDQILPPKFRFLTKCSYVGAFAIGALTNATNSLTMVVNTSWIAFPFVTPTGYSVYTQSTPSAGGFPGSTVSKPNGWGNLMNANCYQQYRCLASRIKVTVQPQTVGDTVEVYVAPIQATQNPAFGPVNFPGYQSVYTISQAPRMKRITAISGENRSVFNEVNLWDLIGVTKQNFLDQNQIQHTYAAPYPAGGGGANFNLATYDTFWQITVATPDLLGNTQPIVFEVSVEYYVQAEALNLVGLLDQ